jgi:Fur family ferric uptake transcriptional regulator
MLASLQQQGFRLTSQRALILEDLFHNPGHRTVEDIFQHVSERLPGLNRATIYRTLEMLRAVNLVAASTGPEGVTQFEFVRADGHLPHHLVCRGCGVQIDLGAEPVEQLKSAILHSHGFHAELDHLHISGLCSTCAAD